MSLQPLSNEEMKIMRHVWLHGPASVRLLHERMQEEYDVDFRTVQTQLRRLESKGYVVSSREGKNLVYKTKARKQSVIKKTLGDLVDRLFGGNSAEMMQHMLSQSDLSAEEIEQLRNMLDQQEPINE